LPEPIGLWRESRMSFPASGDR